MIKAALGGGGKGMRLSGSKEDFEKNFRIAQAEAKQCFGDDAMYLEHYIKGPRHVEFQILADSHGNVVHLGERDCSIQRKHQKLRAAYYHPDSGWRWDRQRYVRQRQQDI